MYGLMMGSSRLYIYRSKKMDDYFKSKVLTGIAHNVVPMIIKGATLLQWKYLNILSNTLQKVFDIL